MSRYEQSESNTLKRVVIPHLNTLKSITKNGSLTPRSVRLFGRKDGSGKSYYNCWGFTAFAFKWNPKLCWLSEGSIERYLEAFTKPVRKPKTGDILVMRRFSSLQHTAILVDAENKLAIHKPGGWKLEVNTIEGVEEIYPGLKITYRRIKEITA